MDGDSATSIGAGDLFSLLPLMARFAGQCHQIVNSAGSSPTISGGKIIFLRFRPILEDLRLKSTDPLGTYLTEHLVEGMAVRERQWMD